MSDLEYDQYRCLHHNGHQQSESPVCYRHGTHPSHPNILMSSYDDHQIYQLLKKTNPDFCQILIEACGGEYIGKDAGSNVGPAQKIAQALGRNQNIETQYHDVRYMAIAGNDATGEDCGIFRLRS